MHNPFFLDGLNLPRLGEHRRGTSGSPPAANANETLASGGIPTKKSIGSFYTHVVGAVGPLSHSSMVSMPLTPLFCEVPSRDYVAIVQHSRVE